MTNQGSESREMRATGALQATNLVSPLMEFPLPWDEVKQARVRERVMQARRSGRLTLATETSVPAPARVPTFWTFAAVGAVAGSFALGAGVMIGRSWPDRGTQSVAANPISGKTWELSDGSRVEIATDTPADSVVALKEDGSAALAFVQRKGSVRYDFRGHPGRRFRVDVGGVHVEVLSAVFNMAVDGARVRVDVEHGSVHVNGSGDEHVVNEAQSLVVPLRAERASLPGENAAEAIAGLNPGEPNEGAHVSEPAEDGLLPVRARAASRGLERTMDKVDHLRRAGDLPAAAALLQRATREGRGEGRERLSTAYFMLGKVQKSRGLFVDAARAFRSSWTVARRGALAEDALAQEALAWKAAQNRTRGTAAARLYLRLHAEGAHAESMRQLLR